VDHLLNWIRTTYDPQTLFWSWGGIILSLVVIHGFELVSPAQRGQSYRTIGFNCLATFAYLSLTPIANFMPGYVVTSAVQAAHGPWFAIDLPSIIADQSGLSRVALLALFAFVPLFIFDFFYYWFHRWQHMNRWAWEQHKLHHTDEALNVTTSFRVHWTEGGFRGILVSIPMAILFKITPVEAGIVTLFTGHWGYLIHANLRLPFGPLTSVLVGPQAHRIHHSILPEHRNRNFAAFFPIWDILFGTFHRPGSREFPPTGVVGEASRPPIKDVFFGPFVAWLSMTRSASRKALGPRTAQTDRHKGPAVHHPQARHNRRLSLAGPSSAVVARSASLS
jgi:sterol desaturase/sphingolipid hydroxylase (fatty acid hydroxylase superfamily)